MIYDIASKAVEYIDRKGYLENENNEVIVYGLFSVLSKLFYAILCITIGFAFQIGIESIVFYVSFLFIKKYSGGFHCSTEGRCIVVSSLSIIFSLTLIKLLISFQTNIHIMIFFAFICVIYIATKSPVVAKEKPLNEDEMKKYKKYAVVRIFIIMTILIILIVLSYMNFAVPIFVSIILECIFLFIKY